MRKIITISIVCVFVSLIVGCQLGYIGACKKFRKGPGTIVQCLKRLDNDCYLKLVKHKG